MNLPPHKPIPVEKLTEELLRKIPIWEFCNDDEAGETPVRPVKKFPVSSGDNHLFGCELRFSDGSTGFGLLGNLSLTNPEQNLHFRTLSVFEGGREYYLPRYHDFDFEKRGPKALANSLRKKVGDIFPISYNLSGVATGAVQCIRGSIPSEPEKKLSRAEIIQLALHS